MATFNSDEPLTIVNVDMTAQPIPRMIAHDGIEHPIDPLDDHNTWIGPTFRARVHIVPKYAEEGEPFMPHHYNQLLRVLIEIRNELENICDKT